MIEGVALTTVSGGENWRVIAACRFVDPELFFPISAAGRCLEQVVEAKKVCARCLVQAECLTFAQRTGQAHGISRVPRSGGTGSREPSPARKGSICGRTPACSAS